MTNKDKFEITFNEKEARYIGKMLDEQHGLCEDSAYSWRKKSNNLTARNHASNHANFVSKILQKFLTALDIGTVWMHEEI